MRLHTLGANVVVLNPCAKQPGAGDFYNRYAGESAATEGGKCIATEIISIRIVAIPDFYDRITSSGIDWYLRHRFFTLIHPQHK